MASVTEAGFRGDQWFDRGDGGGEYRFGGQQVGAHARPLRALPGEHPDRSAVVLADRGWVGGSPVATSRSASVSSAVVAASTAVRTGRCPRRRARV